MSLNYADARHFLVRTGYGATRGQILALVGTSIADSVDALLASHTHSDVAVTPMPEWVDEAPPTRTEVRRDRPAAQRRRRRRGRELKSWWYTELLDTERPFLERMTLFWHNHFTSSLRSVRHPPALYHQNVLLRRHALGSFAEMLSEIAGDPAMLTFLDGRSNTAEHPNENFARELLELFTLGEGHYSEADIREAARAFTGWRINRLSGQSYTSTYHHDAGQKTFLGRSGAFNGADILDILLQQERTAILIVEKAWRAFVSPEPEALAVARLADGFRDSNYNIAMLMRQLLCGDAFWSPSARASLIKSPVDLIVGTLRTFGISYDRGEAVRPLLRLGRRLGQDLFDPPNVKGWPGHTAWISTATLLVRHRALRRVALTPQVLATVAREGFADWLGVPEVDALQAFTETVLAMAPVNDIEATAGPETQLAQVLLDPAYQLR